MKKKTLPGSGHPLAINEALQSIIHLAEPRAIMSYCIEALGLIDRHDETKARPFSNLSYIADNILLPLVDRDKGSACKGIHEYVTDYTSLHHHLDSTFDMIDNFLIKAHENETVQEVTHTVMTLMKIMYKAYVDMADEDATR